MFPSQFSTNLTEFYRISAKESVKTWTISGSLQRQSRSRVWIRFLMFCRYASLSCFVFWAETRTKLRSAANHKKRSRYFESRHRVWSTRSSSLQTDWEGGDRLQSVSGAFTLRQDAVGLSWASPLWALSFPACLALCVWPSLATWSVSHISSRAEMNQHAPPASLRPSPSLILTFRPTQSSASDWSLHDLQRLSGPRDFRDIIIYRCFGFFCSAL